MGENVVETQDNRYNLFELEQEFNYLEFYQGPEWIDHLNKPTVQNYTIDMKKFHSNTVRYYY